jgi:ABC-2 type transport system permease protein
MPGIGLRGFAREAVAVKNPRRKLRRDAMIAIALWLLFFCFANWAAAPMRARWDYTTSGQHTLSHETLHVLKQAKSPIRIRAFLPGHVPQPYKNVVNGIRNGLADYKQASSVPFEIQIVDPLDPDLNEQEKAELERKARDYGLKKADLQVIKADRRIRQSVWFGVVILYEAKQMLVPHIDDANQLEYALTRTLKRIILRKKRRTIVGLSVGHGEPPISQSPLKGALSTIGELQDVRIDGSNIPRDVDVLVVLGPKRPFSSREQYTIDQFLMRGKSLLCFLDYRAQSTVFPEVLVPTVSGLENLFAAYGLKVDTDKTLLDRHAPAQAPIKRDQGGRIVTGAHPLYPFVKPAKGGHPTTVNISHVVMPMSSPVDTTGAEQLGYQISTLFRAADTTMLRTDVRNNSPEKYLEPQAGEIKATNRSVAVAMTGIIRSAFDGILKPEAPAASPFGKASPIMPFLVESQGDARLLLATSGTRMLAAQNNSIQFFQNAIDWGATDSVLTSIRSRPVQTSRLNIVSGRIRLWVRASALLAPTILLLVFGWFIRRKIYQR